MQGSPRAERLEMRCGTWCRSTVVKLSTDSNVWSSKPCSLSIRDCVEGRRGVSLAGLAGAWIYQGIAAVCPPTLSRRKITPFRRVGSLLPEITLAGEWAAHVHLSPDVSESLTNLMVHQGNVTPALQYRVELKCIATGLSCRGLLLSTV